MRALLATLACLGVAGLACAEEGGADAQHSASITASELLERIAASEAPFILDVRTPGEFERGHVAGAVNVPHTALASKRSELPADLDAEIVVHCESGGRALTAERWLREQGYTHVRDLEEHMRGWRTAGHPTAKP